MSYCSFFHLSLGFCSTKADRPRRCCVKGPLFLDPFGTFKQQTGSDGRIQSFRFVLFSLSINTAFCRGSAKAIKMFLSIKECSSFIGLDFFSTLSGYLFFQFFGEGNPYPVMLV